MILTHLGAKEETNAREGVRFKIGALFVFLADSSRALQACGQGTASAVQVAAGRHGRYLNTFPHFRPADGPRS
jgi:hypothetical protein